MTSEQSSPEFDFSDYSETFNEANKNSRDKTVPLDLKDATDSREVEVVKMGRGTSKYIGSDGNEVETPKVWAALRLMDGKFSGETVFKSWFLKNDPESLKHAVQDWKTMGIARLNSLDDMNDDENLKTVYGNRLAVSIYTTKSPKNGKTYGNIKIQRRVSTVSEA